MTAVKQVKRAVVKAIADAGGMAVESYSAEKFKMSERAVRAVGPTAPMRACNFPS